MVSFETALNAMLNRFNVKLQRNRPRRNAVQLLLLKAQERGVQTILDVGANVGQFGADLRARGWTGPIVSFEPLAGPHAELIRRAKDDQRWVVPAPVAIGAASGETVINVSANVDSSSLLAVEERSVRVVAATAMTGTQSVMVRTLDAMIDADWPSPFAIKIDTQGFELEVLKGARAALARTEVVMVEMSLTPLYRGGAPFAELYRYLEEDGFRCIALPETFADTAQEETLQVDGVFVRSHG